MGVLKNLVRRYRRFRFWLYCTRATLRRRKRLLFTSPAEVKFIRLMGGRVSTWKLPLARFPLTFVWSLGPHLKAEQMRREVRAGAMFIDFGVVTPYYKKGIEIDGQDFHRDIVAERSRDQYVAQFGWRLLHVEAKILWNQPWRVKREVLEWLESD